MVSEARSTSYISHGQAVGSVVAGDGVGGCAWRGPCVAAVTRERTANMVKRGRKDITMEAPPTLMPALGALYAAS
jgi:hypothetical protein